MKRLSTIVQERLIINENFVNVFSAKDKAEYVDKVWYMLQSGYASQGGIHGDGFKDKQDMINHIPFWKIGKTNGVINSVALYKDSNGRKRVASSTNGSEEGKKKMLEIMLADLTAGRCYVEVSGRSLSFLANNIHNLKKYAVDTDVARKKLNTTCSVPDSNDPEILRHPELSEFFYVREIGSHSHTKCMLGNVNSDTILYDE